MHKIIIQNATKEKFVPKATLFKKWASVALSSQAAAKKASEDIKGFEVTIRIVDEEEMSALNSQFRRKQGPTNVLSFPFNMQAGVELDLPILGDIAICAPVVYQEAQAQGKPLEAHFAHLVIHGVFHLLGYDHKTDQEADAMETLEITALKGLGFPNPY